MTAQEYIMRLADIDKELESLSKEKDNLIKERVKLITKDLEDLGLKQGMDVDLIDGGIERRCRFNGVRNMYGFIYLEFETEVYDDNYLGKYPRQLVDITHDITVILPDASFNYKTFMSNYQ